jgi:hypothetical protein
MEKPRSGVRPGLSATGANKETSTARLSALDLNLLIRLDEDTLAVQKQDLDEAGVLSGIDPDDL